MSRLIADKYAEWQAECEERFLQLKANEEELNRIFIDIYGLQEELTPDVADKDVTVHRVYNTKDDIPESMKGSAYIRTMHDEIVSLISYAVGCIFGRYSHYTEGLVYAGGEFSDKWVVVSGKNGIANSGTNHSSLITNHYYLRSEVERLVGNELQRIDSMAESDEFGGGSISFSEASSKRGNVCIIGSDEKSSGINSVKRSGGTSTKLYEGIRELPIDSEGVKFGIGDTTYDLCSPEILDAISNENSDELVARGWKDADRIDWKTIHYTLTANYYCPDADNIVPICDDEYFEDDLAGRIFKWVETVYGKETLEENLKFIADALGGKGTSREVIRNYLFNGFYADHLKTYQKRPIYWLFSSGKKNGFKALIYMHRYKHDLLARMRTDYVHEQQERYRTQLTILEDSLISATPSEKVKINKQITKLRDQSLEIQKFEEKLHHLADQMISIDLDDGVKVNYAKFAEVVEKIK